MKASGKRINIKKKKKSVFNHIEQFYKLIKSLFQEQVFKYLKPARLFFFLFL